MNNKLWANIDVIGCHGIVSFECFIDKRPSIKLNPDIPPYISTSTWLASQYKWEDIQITFKKINVRAERFFISWLNSIYDYYVGTTNHNYKKEMRVKIIDATGIIVEEWVLFGVSIVELNPNFSFYERFRNVIKNKIYSRMVLFEKVGNQTSQINCDLIISISKAVLHL